MRKIFIATILGAALSISACGPSEEEKRAEAQRVAQQQEIARQQEAERAEQERLAQQQAAYRTCIQSVVQTDAGLGAVSHGDTGRQAEAMRQIDLSGCPGDFAAAYIAHTQAWERAAKIDQALAQLNSDDNVSQTVVGSVLADIFGFADVSPISDAIAANNRLKQERAAAGTLITETFNEVERVAALYGVSVPRG